MERIWRPVKDYEECYEVSNDGLVRSLDRMVPHSRKGFFRREKGKPLSPATDGYGYFFVSLSSNGRKRLPKIHQLVAENFIGKPEGDYQVNHKSGDKKDNRVENLEYVTPKENTLHSINELGHRRDGINHWKHKLTVAQVEEMRKLYKTGDFSQIELAKRYGIHRGQLSKICNYKSWWIH